MLNPGTRSPSSVAGYGCLVLFGLPFAAIGTALAYTIIHTLIKLALMQGWPTVPATLQTVTLESTSATSGSEKAAATYSYDFAGQRRTGHRVSLYGADNIGSFHKDAYNTLNGYLSRKEPYPLHVNPNSPDESILLPVLRWEAIGFNFLFMIVFGGVGWLLILTSFFGIRRTRQEAVLILQFPNEPWKQRTVWADSRIKSTQSFNATVQICLAVLWNVTSAPVLLVVPGAVADGQYFTLTFLLFPLVGIGLIYWAAVAIARARRFGGAYLHLDTMPVAPGGQLRGQIYASKALENAGSVALTLRCEKTSRVSHGSNQSAYKTVDVWHAKSSTPVVRGQTPSGEVLLNVAINVSGEFPGTTFGAAAGRSGGDEYRWYLAASAPLEGADFAAEFEVPVFKR